MTQSTRAACDRKHASTVAKARTLRDSRVRCTAQCTPDMTAPEVGGPLERVARTSRRRPRFVQLPIALDDLLPSIPPPLSYLHVTSSELRGATAPVEVALPLYCRCMRQWREWECRPRRPRIHCLREDTKSPSPQPRQRAEVCSVAPQKMAGPLRGDVLSLSSTAVCASPRAQLPDRLNPLD
ncbi:hypothetical protein BU26DRAFT_170761 [Trematosphaeria pertusa]|uniref:Uncharacterized protein n=1 Tax=Trematosphaeria pertusa TaxID=390896 RepID=A0A6A6HW74_9PLEO|nr:uncharacterized protein BU26DRAFT_170761 [Trematosphaeria pertusa]KAF2241813.1 hypothetical protein BU26DRAFT_170761 [Trematosphaeria pertusa]